MNIENILNMVQNFERNNIHFRCLDKSFFIDTTVDKHKIYIDFFQDYITKHYFNTKNYYIKKE